MIMYPVGKPCIGKDEIFEITKSIERGQLTQGVNVQNFEEGFAKFVGSKHAVMCASGTAALHLALAASKIGPGDEVLVPDLTYVASANAVRYLGAKPVFVDVNQYDWNICLTNAKKKITTRTRAIIPVHIYGNSCNMDEVDKFAKRYSLKVIEDAAEAIGGYWNKKHCGTFGRMGAFSFYANKVITCGEGGCVVTDDDRVANNLRFFRGQAQSPSRRFFHEAVGFNYRMTDILAAIGLSQILKIHDFIQQRHRVVSIYRKKLKDFLEFPVYEGIAPWLFTGVSKIPYSTLKPLLEGHGIETRPMFVPMHQLPMYYHRNDYFPVSTKLAEYGISLPTYPDLSNEDVNYIANAVCEVIYENSRS